MIFLQRWEFSPVSQLLVEPFQDDEILIKTDVAAANEF